MHTSIPLYTAGTSTSPNDNDHYFVRLPALLSGVRCYTDASTSPDLHSNTYRNAGIGIFIINNQIHPVQTIYIKAIMKATTSVLMAEAAALALATTIRLQQVSFLSDNQELVHFLNGPDQADPPNWRIKYYAQTFTIFSTTSENRVFKIQRAQNYTADALARQSFFQSQSSSPTVLICTCSNMQHMFSALFEKHFSLLL